MKIATLGLIVVDNRILLGEKLDGKFQGLVNGPGGMVEEGESLVDCLVREIMEEFMILLDRSDLSPAAILRCYAGDVLDLVVHVFKTSTYYGEPMPTSSMRPFWADLDKIPYDLMHEADRLWLPLVLSGSYLEANLYYRESGKGFLGITFT